MTTVHRCDATVKGVIVTRATIPGPAEPLSSREQQVLRLLAAGRANREIAAELVVTLNTVKRHVTHILAKLGAVNRTEAAAPLPAILV
jgi:LuxR family maltose regulon positive regulatory protein